MSSKWAPKGRGHDATGRTPGTDQAHVRLYEWMMKSSAWQALTAAEVRVYIEVERRYFGKGTNNGRIGLSVRTAAKACRIAKGTATLALERLERLGFIDCVTPGGFSRKTRHAAEWRLTREKCDVTGDPASKDFMRWKPTAPIATELGTKSGTVRSQMEDTRTRKAS